MSKEKYNQVINREYDIPETYGWSALETYMRLAYIKCVKCDQDIDDIDKIIAFIFSNFSFFDGLTENKELEEWMREHVMFLANDKPEIDLPERLEMSDYLHIVTLDTLEDVDMMRLNQAAYDIPTYIENIASDLNYAIISEKLAMNAQRIQDIARDCGMVHLYEACDDFITYCDYYEDLDEMIRFYQIIDIQAYKVLEVIARMQSMY